MSEAFQINKHGKESAMQFSPELANIVAIWCNGALVEEIDPETNERFPALNVQCGEDVKRASIGDWVVKKEDKTFEVMGPNEYLAHFDHA